MQPIGMALMVYFFLFGVQRDMTRYCLTRAKPKTLKQIFALALGEDCVVASSYLHAASLPPQTPGPEPRELDVIEIFRGHKNLYATIIAVKMRRSVFDAARHAIVRLFVAHPRWWP